MRILLDALISTQRVAVPLREAGHGVRAVAEERKLDGTPDEELLALAAEEERVLVTRDVDDFPAITCYPRSGLSGVRRRGELVTRKKREDSFCSK